MRALGLSDGAPGACMRGPRGDEGQLDLGARPRGERRWPRCPASEHGTPRCGLRALGGRMRCPPPTLRRQGRGRRPADGGARPARGSEPGDRGAATRRPCLAGGPIGRRTIRGVPYRIWFTRDGREGPKRTRHQQVRAAQDPPTAPSASPDGGGPSSRPSRLRVRPRSKRTHGSGGGPSAGGAHAALALAPAPCLGASSSRSAAESRERSSSISCQPCDSGDRAREALRVDWGTR